MSDFNNPLSNQVYLALLASIVENNQSVLKMLDGVAPLDNLPVNSKRWSSANARFENWNGLIWAELSALFEMKVRNSDQLNGQTESFYRNASNMNAGTLPAGQFNDTTHGVRAGGSLHAAATTSVNGFMSSSDKTKLDAIEASATVDMTPGELLTALLSVDGAGSGLDADLLDGLHGASYLKGVNNLSDIALASTARTNLGLGSLATLSQVPSASIGQSELKSTIADQSLSINAGFFGVISAIGARYSLMCFPDASAASIVPWDLITSSGNSFTVPFKNNSGATGTAYLFSRYVQASPPYDWGDGEIPLFVYIQVDNATEKPLSISVAPEASFHYNGPTSIIATRKDKVGGRSWKEVPKIIADLHEANLTKQEAIRLGMHTRDEIADRILNDTKAEIELTQAVKNADMNIIPHPYVGNDLRGTTMVMLDPVSPKTEKLLQLHNDGERILKLIEDGKITFGSAALNRSMPPGVIAVDFTL